MNAGSENVYSAHSGGVDSGSVNTTYFRLMEPKLSGKVNSKIAGAVALLALAGFGYFVYDGLSFDSPEAVRARQDKETAKETERIRQRAEQTGAIWERAQKIQGMESDGNLSSAERKERERLLAEIKELDPTLVRAQNPTDDLADEQKLKPVVKSSVNNAGSVVVKGSIENTSRRITSYWEVTVDFLDKNDQVIHSQMTNSIDQLAPGKKHEWRIEKSELPNCVSVRARITEAFWAN